MINLTFQQIAMFLEVARRLNITEVANDMYISQAAMSRMILRMEESIGVKLFVRSNRGLSLTPEGEFLYSRLRRAYNSVSTALDDVKRLSTSNQQILKIGYPTTIDNNHDYDKLKRHIALYAASHPNVEISESLLEFADLKQALMYGDLDVAFVHSFALVEENSFNSKPAVNCRSFLMVSEHHPLADVRSFTMDMVEDERFVVLPLTDSPMENLRINLFKTGFNPKKFVRAPNLQTLTRLVETRNCVAFSGKFLDSETAHVRFIPYYKEEVTHTLQLVWRIDETSPTAKGFIGSFSGDPADLTEFVD